MIKILICSDYYLQNRLQDLIEKRIIKMRLENSVCIL